MVGGGVAGIVASWLLQHSHHVTLFEANDYLGGHTHTVVIQEGSDAGTPVDTGFIVLNDRTYPLFRSFLSNLRVDTRETQMSFSFHDQVRDLTYSGSGLNGLFAQRINLLRPSFWRMLRGVMRFFREAKRDLERGTVPEVSVGQYLAGRYPRETIEDHLIPMASAIWSAIPGQIQQFPAETFLRFFDNHGLLGIRDRPRWMTVAGGSHTYVKAFENSFKGRIRLNTPVTVISRRNGAVFLQTRPGERLEFDRVVVATHADDALKLLADPSDEEVRLLGAWRYQDNVTVLHTDTSVLPPIQRAWACWNYCRERSAEEVHPVSVSYSMNLLQGLSTEQHYCVSLNRSNPVREDAVIAQMVYRHPVYNFDSVKAQGELTSINGQRGTWFCGSYFGYGFHEDAVRSAVQVGKAFGVTL